MARDRKRAKQRRERERGGLARRARGARRDGGAGDTPPAGSAPSQARPGGEGPDEEAARSPAPGTIERADLPGSLGHAGEVDEFDAALIRGADGVEAPDPIADAPEHLSESEIEAEAVVEGENVEDLLQEPGGPDGRHATPEQASGAPIQSGNRVIGFLRASWAELQRVQWPDRRQVTQATAVVLGFVAVAGVYLGVADTVAKEIVEFIL